MVHLQLWFFHSSLNPLISSDVLPFDMHLTDHMIYCISKSKVLVTHLN